MPKLVNHRGDDGVLPSGLLCYTRRKRPTHASPLYRAEKKHQPGPCSLDAVPDEVLREILRRLPGNRERSVSAFVSKRWLLLLSGIRASEPSLKEEETRKRSAKKSRGSLTRCLQGRVTDVMVAALALGTAGRGGLGKLVINGSRFRAPPDPRLTDLGLSAVARCCPSLKELSIRNVPNITDVGLAELARGCPMIEKLELGLCPLVTGKRLLAMPEKFPNLVTITLDSCVSFGNEGLQAIGSCSSKLKSVSIKDCPLIGDQGIAAMMRSATSSLAMLMLRNLNVGDRALRCIGRYGKGLTHLRLVGLRNVERGFWSMGSDIGLQKLKSVAVSDSRGDTAVSLMCVAKGCPELKELCLRRCCDVSDADLKDFAKYAHALENLQLEECDGITLVGVIACLVTHNTRIKTLGLVKCLGIKDVGICTDILPECESLRTLTVHGCPGFTGANLPDLGKICRNLNDLDIGELVGMTDDMILPVIWTNALVKVNLRGCANLTVPAICTLVVDHGLRLQVLKLEGCCKLTDRVLFEISRKCTELKQLDMSGADVTDYGVALLASARLLKVSVLSFAGCAKLTPWCLPLLANMGPTLVRLNLQNCDLISEDDIASLEEDMEWCDIN